VKIALITGANSGIGKETTRALLASNYQVLMVCRNEQRAKPVYQEFIQQFPHAKLSYVLADLSDMSQIRRAAEMITDQVEKIDLLINNAGVMLTQRKETVDGFEQTFAVNHFAYFLLTSKLLPLLRKAGSVERYARIINVASRAHKRVSLNLKDPMFRQGRYLGWPVYCHSKLANVLYTRELSRRLQGQYITVNCLHPGMVNTGFTRNFKGIIGRIAKLFFSTQLTPKEGAKTTIFLALDHSVEGKSGGYYSECRSIASSKEGANLEKALRLWKYTEDQLSSFLSEQL